MNLRVIFSVTLMIVCLACSAKSGRKLHPVQANEIEIGEIKKDLVGESAVRLTRKQIVQLVEWINTTQNAHMRKALPEYWIFLKTKDNLLLYKVNGDMLGESDLYIELEEEDYIRRIYETGKKQPTEIHFRMGCSNSKVLSDLLFQRFVLS